jgi:hypothetical protein
MERENEEMRNEKFSITAVWQFSESVKAATART